MPSQPGCAAFLRFLFGAPPDRDATRLGVVDLARELPEAHRCLRDLPRLSDGLITWADVWSGLVARLDELTAESERLLAVAAKDPVVPEAYRQVWASLHDRVIHGLRDWTRFQDAGRALVGGATVPTESAPELISAWTTLFPVDDAHQVDGGAALLAEIEREAIEAVLLPWSRLAQLVEEALPREAPPGSALARAVRRSRTFVRDVQAAWSAVGYRYVHVPLYETRREDLASFGDRITCREVRIDDLLPGMPVPADAGASVVVRVPVPVLEDHPPGHRVQASAHCLESG